MGVTQIGMLVLNWRKFLLYVWLPHFFAQWGIVSMNMLQHDGCDVNVDPDSRCVCVYVCVLIVRACACPWRCLAEWRLMCVL